ncbi:MAG: arsenate reductase (glutaredoxin) [Bacteroidetes bacterium]|nr:arsenate reductase (glutaredoxin) [Bacteroidota bacterium]
MSNTIKIYHNPRCTKSRETLDLIQKKNKNVEVIEYIKTPPTEKELKEIIKMLGIKAEQLIRKKEKLFEEKYKNKKLSEDAWIKAMVKNPILIERPIIINGKKAAIGRPPEKVLEIL